MTKQQEKAKPIYEIQEKSHKPKELMFTEAEVDSMCLQSRYLGKLDVLLGVGSLLIGVYLAYKGSTRIRCVVKQIQEYRNETQNQKKGE